MDLNSLVGQRFGNIFIAVGTIHQLGKKSFSFEAFERPIQLELPINNYDWYRKRSSATSGRYKRGVSKGKTTTREAAKRAVIAYCPIPPRPSYTVYNDNRLPSSTLEDTMQTTMKMSSPEMDLMSVAIAATATMSLLKNRR